MVCDGDKYRAMIEREGGAEALRQWKSLEEAMKPLQAGAASLPAAAIRNDLGIVLTHAILRLSVHDLACHIGTEKGFNRLLMSILYRGGLDSP